MDDNVKVGDNSPFNEEDFRKDGNLKVSAVRRMEESVSPRGSSRSYNEVSGETTVTTVLDGQTVTFVQDGDKREDSEVRESDRATGPAIKGQDQAPKGDETVANGEGE